MFFQIPEQLLLRIISDQRSLSIPFIKSLDLSDFSRCDLNDPSPSLSIVVDGVVAVEYLTIAGLDLPLLDVLQRAGDSKEEGEDPELSHSW